jgi:hypothetical protein
VAASEKNEAGEPVGDVVLVVSSKGARDLVIEQFGAVEGGKQTMARLSAYLEGVI